jgi:hypothetical protein
MKKSTAVVLIVTAIVGGVFASSLVQAQEKAQGQATTPKASEDRINSATRFYDLKHASARSVERVLAMFSGGTNSDESANRVMWTGPKELAPAIDDAVKRLDVPPPVAPSLELTFHILAASSSRQYERPLPPDLEGVAKQVKSVFSVSSVTLLETAMLRTSVGQRGRVQGKIKPWSPGVQEAEYNITFGRVEISEDAKGKSVRVPELEFEMPIVGGEGANKGVAKVKLETSIDAREGQKAVVGKASVDRTDETILLVVTARLVE